MNCVCCEPPWAFRMGTGTPGNVSHIVYSDGDPPVPLWTADHGAGVRRVRFDAAGNVYTLGTVPLGVAPTAGIDHGVVLIRKYSPSGIPLWSAGTAAEKSLEVDVNGDVYTGSPLVKYDTHGAVQWVVEETPTFTAGYGIALMGDAVYAVAYDSSVGVFPVHLCRFKKSDGSLVWAKQIEYQDAATPKIQHKLAARNNVIWLITHDPDSIGGEYALLQFDTVGNLNWELFPFPALSSFTAAVDSSSHYFLKTHFPGRVLEIDSSGVNVTLWTNFETTNPNTPIHIDESDTVYVGYSQYEDPEIGPTWKNHGPSGGAGSVLWGMTWPATSLNRFGEPQPIGNVIDISRSVNGRFAVSGSRYVDRGPSVPI